MRNIFAICGLGLCFFCHWGGWPRLVISWSLGVDISAGSSIMPGMRETAGFPWVYAVRAPFCAGVMAFGLHGAGLLWWLHVAALWPVPLPVLSFSLTLNALSATANPVAHPVAQAASDMPAQAEPVPVKPAALHKVKVAAAVVHEVIRAPQARAQAAVVAPLTPAQYDAAYLHNPAPAYPAVSRRLNEEGTVALRVFVNAQGAAEQVLLYHSSGFARLDEAAVEAVKSWQFAPAHAGQQVLASWVDVPVIFKLEVR